MINYVRVKIALPENKFVIIWAKEKSSNNNLFIFEECDKEGSTLEGEKIKIYICDSGTVIWKKKAKMNPHYCLLKIER